MRVASVPWNIDPRQSLEGLTELGSGPTWVFAFLNTQPICGTMAEPIPSFLRAVLEDAQQQSGFSFNCIRVVRCDDKRVPAHSHCSCTNAVADALVSDAKEYTVRYALASWIRGARVWERLSELFWQFPGRDEELPFPPQKRQ